MRDLFIVCIIIASMITGYVISHTINEAKLESHGSFGISTGITVNPILGNATNSPSFLSTTTDSRITKEFPISGGKGDVKLSLSTYSTSSGVLSSNLTPYVSNDCSTYYVWRGYSTSTTDITVATTTIDFAFDYRDEPTSTASFMLDDVIGNCMYFEVRRGVINNALSSNYSEIYIESSVSE